MKTYITLTTTIAILSTIGCDNPTKPSLITTAPAIKKSNLTYDAVQFYVNDELGRARVTNNTGADAEFVFILFDYNDGINQIDLVKSFKTIKAGATEEITVGYHPDPQCKPITIQPDVFINPPKLGPNGKYTLSELNLYAGGSLRTINTGGKCEPPPCTINCEPVICQVKYHTYTFEQDTWLATFPIGYPNPWYPSTIGPIPVTIDAGKNHFSSVTGDKYHFIDYDPSPEQEHEILRYKFEDGQQTPTTNDVPTDKLVIDTDLGNLIFSSIQHFLTVIHTGPINEIPSDSVAPITLTWNNVCESK